MPYEDIYKGLTEEEKERMLKMKPEVPYGYQFQ